MKKKTMKRAMLSLLRYVFFLELGVDFNSNKKHIADYLSNEKNMDLSMKDKKEHFDIMHIEHMSSPLTQCKHYH
jgi:hypothetical protein